MEVIKGVEHVAREHGLAVVVSSLQEDHHPPATGWIEGVIGRRPHGVIVVFSGLTKAQHEQFKTRDIPVVLVDPTGDPGHELPSVGAGNWSGGLSAARHLLELGHRRIGLITGPAHALSSRARLDGFRAAMDAMRRADGPAARQAGRLQRRGRPGARPLPARDAPAPDRRFRLQRRAGHGRLPGGPRDGPAHPRRAERGRLRRPADGAVAHPRADHGAPAAGRDGRRRHGHGRRHRPGESPVQNRIELTTGLVVRGSTAPLVA